MRKETFSYRKLMLCYGKMQAEDAEESTIKKLFLLIVGVWKTVSRKFK